MESFERSTERVLDLPKNLKSSLADVIWNSQIPLAWIYYIAIPRFLMEQQLGSVDAGRITSFPNLGYNAICIAYPKGLDFKWGLVK